MNIKTPITLMLAMVAMPLFAQDNPTPKPEISAKMLKAFDKDGDGVLSESERKAASEAIKQREEKMKQMLLKRASLIVKKYDKDGDSKLSESELAAFLENSHRFGRPQRQPKLSPETIKKYDKDGDGKLSREERKKMIEENPELFRSVPPPPPNRFRERKNGEMPPPPPPNEDGNLPPPPLD